MLRIGSAAGLVLSAMLLLFSACGDGGGPGSGGGKLKVVATTVQVTALAREVGGDDIELRGIVPAGADAHTFEPRASDLAAIESARLILRNGIGLDSWLDGTLAAGKRARTVTATEGVDLLKEDEGGRQADDPHVWQDPENDKVMVDNIAAALASADPAHAPAYAQRAAAYRQKLNETRAEIEVILAPIPPQSRKLVTNHDSLRYFARAFGLEIVATVIPGVSTESEPSARDTARLLETIREQGVKAIFAESSVNPRLARSLAEEAHVKVVADLYGDSLGLPGSGAETVDGMLLANARKIAAALQ